MRSRHQADVSTQELGVSPEFLEGLRVFQTSSVPILQRICAQIVLRYMRLRPGAFLDRKEDRDDLVSELALLGLSLSHDPLITPESFLDRLDREANRVTQRMRRQRRKHEEFNPDTDSPILSANHFDEFLTEELINDRSRVIHKVIFRGLGVLSERVRQEILSEVHRVRSDHTHVPKLSSRATAAWSVAIRQVITEDTHSPETRPGEIQTIRALHDFFAPRGRGNRDHQAMFRMFARGLAGAVEKRR